MYRLSAILMMWCSAWCLASPTTLTLHAHAEVNDTTIKLGDIARVHDDDQELVRRLEKLVLLPAPDLGRSIRLNQVEIKEMIQRQAGEAVSVHAESPARVEVTRIEPGREPTKLSNQTIEECRKQIEEVVQRDLNQEFGGAVFHIRIEGEEAVRHLAKHAGDEWAVIAPSAWHEGWQQAGIEFPEPVGAVQFPIRIELVRDREVVAVRWTIEKGHRIEMDDLVLVSQPTRSTSVESVSDPQLVVGMEAKRDITGGSVLSARDIGKRPVVFRGQPVTVTVAFGTAWVQRTFLAGRDAGVGDWIEVTDPESRAGRPHDYLVRVTGPHQAALPQDAPVSRAISRAKPTVPSAVPRRR